MDVAAASCLHSPACVAIEFSICPIVLTPMPSLRERLKRTRLRVAVIDGDTMVERVRWPLKRIVFGVISSLRKRIWHSCKFLLGIHDR